MSVILVVLTMDSRIVGYVLDLDDTRGIVAGRSDAAGAVAMVLRARSGASPGRRFGMDLLLDRLEALDPATSLRIERRAAARALRA